MKRTRSQAVQIINSYLFKISGETEHGEEEQKTRRSSQNPNKGQDKSLKATELTTTTKTKSTVTSAAHRLEAFQLNSSLLFQPNPPVFLMLSHVSMTYCYKQI